MYVCMTKKLVHSSSVLVHYDLNKPLSVASDASPYGAGAVLEHIMPDGTERPVAFASRTMSSTERNYAQIDKKALSMSSPLKSFISIFSIGILRSLQITSPCLVFLSQRKLYL